MHRYNIVSGIFLTFSIIYFALAAPVLVQEKRQASVDVVHMPRDMIIMLGKRMDEDFNEFSRLVKEHFKLFRKPAGSSSSAPPGLDHGSKNVVQEPAPNLASSAANPSPLMQPSGPSSPTSPETSLSDHSEDLEWMVGLDEMLGSHAPQPNSKKRPWTDLDLDPDFNSNYRMNFANRPPPRPASLVEPAGGWMNPPRPASLVEPTGGWMNGKQPLPSSPEELSPVSSPDNEPPRTGDGLNELLLELFGDPEDHFSKPESSSAARPWSMPADGWTDVKLPLPSIPEEPSPVSSPEHTPPSQGSLTESGSELMKGVTLPGPSDQALSTSSVDHELMGTHALPNPGPSTESEHEMTDAPLSSPVSLTNPDSVDASGKTGFASES